MQLRKDLLVIAQKAIVTTETRPWSLTSRDLELVVLECQLQNATRRQQIEGMARAFTYAKHIAFNERARYLTAETVQELEGELATLIEPKLGAGYRHIPVVFLNGKTGAPAVDLPRLMYSWTEAYAQQLATPLELYRVYEQHHPRADGNGRNGYCTWCISTYWQTQEWPTELTPDIFDADSMPFPTTSTFGHVER